jgi:hypothetical protein
MKITVFTKVPSHCIKEYKKSLIVRKKSCNVKKIYFLKKIINLKILKPKAVPANTARLL